MNIVSDRYNRRAYSGFGGEGRHLVPRVQVETHAPPVFGKETPADFSSVPPFLDVLEFQ